jgi:hypothetical protein
LVLIAATPRSSHPSGRHGAARKSKHIVDRVFNYGNAYLMQGSAKLRKKGDASGATITAAPLFNLLWFNDDGKIMRYVVDFPPQAAAASDVF